MFSTANPLDTVTRRKARVTAPVTPAASSRFSWEDVLQTWRAALAMFRLPVSPSFVPHRDAELPDFWSKRPDGSCEPPRVVVPGTAVTASALYEHRDDEEASARAWLDAFLWQWLRQRGVHAADVSTALCALQAVVRASDRAGNGYHGNTQQTLPMWLVPIDGRRWDHVVKSAARARENIERRWAIVVPR